MLLLPDQYIYGFRMLSYFAISFILAMALAPSLINGLTRLEWWKKKHKSVASTGEKLTVIKKFTQKVEGDRKVPVSGGILIWGTSALVALAFWVILKLNPDN